MSENMIIDARMLSFSGIGRYTQDLLFGISQLAGNRFQTSIIMRKNEESLLSGSPSLFKSFYTVYHPLSLAEVFRGEKTLHDALLSFKPNKASILFLHWNVPVRYSAEIASFTALVMHDLIPWKDAGHRKRWKTWAAWPVFAAAIMKSDVIIANSNYTRNELASFCVSSRKKVVVVYPPLRQLGSLFGERHVPAGSADRFPVKKYFLYVGTTRSPHKNFKLLLSAWSKACIKMKKQDIYPLVAAGKDTQEDIERMSRSLPDRLVPFLFGLGKVSRQEMDGLMRNAGVVCCPSTMEGFGYVPLEALMHGVPALTTEMPSVVEILNEKRSLPPSDEQKWGEALSSIMGGSGTPYLIEPSAEKAKLITDILSPKKVANSILNIMA